MLTQKFQSLPKFNLPAKAVSPGRTFSQEAPHALKSGRGHFIHGWFCVTDFCHVEPNKPGVYAIYKLNLLTFEKQLLYVGTAQNLATRLKKHEIKKCLNALLDYPWVTYVKVKVVHDTKKRLITEQKLIQRLRPRANYV